MGEKKEVIAILGKDHQASSRKRKPQQEQEIENDER